jgi:hypothetical protein
MFWQGVQGVDIISDLKKETDIWAGLNIGFLNKGSRLLDAWSPTNPDSNIPALTLSDNNNEKRVYPTGSKTVLSSSCAPCSWDTTSPKRWPINC